MKLLKLPTHHNFRPAKPKRFIDILKNFGGEEDLEYNFFVRSPGESKVREHLPSNCRLVMQIPLPVFLSELIPTQQNIFRFGYITYSKYNDQALTSKYEPKNAIYGEKAKGAGAFLEYFTTTHLELRFGVKRISTSDCPGWLRIRQLDKIRLPINELTDIYIWKEKLLQAAIGAEKKYSPRILQANASD